MKPIDLATVAVILIFFIGMTINHNENVKIQKIEKMKKVAKEIVDSKNKGKELEIEWPLKKIN